MTGSATAGGDQPRTGDVLVTTGLIKRFGGTQALRGVDLRVAVGEVLGLIGANGAGKSTLIGILSGALRPSAGSVRLDGRPVDFHSPGDARRAGVQTVYQNIGDGVVPGLSVAENLVLDRFGDLGASGARAGWWFSRRRTHEAAREVAAAAGLAADLAAPVETLSANERQHLIIARALARRPRLLILDEPTAAMSTAEASSLVSAVRRLADGGVAVLYVSHRLDEIEALCDRVTVLRDGLVRREFSAPLEGRRLVAAMIGHGALTDGTGPASRQARRAGAGEPAGPGGASPVLAASGVRCWPSASPFGLVVRPGEVVGVTGLIGAGKTELLEQLYGARPLVSGVLALGGRAYRPRDPAAAVAAGVGFVPEERGAQAIIPAWSLRAHVTLPWLRAASGPWPGLLSGRLERTAAERVIDAFSVMAGGPGAAIETLSGGNQQKVIVGRWIGAERADGQGERRAEREARLLLLDEPFRGVDAGARAEIGRLLRSTAAGAGLGVLLASSDPQEVTQVADRILVLHAGTLAGEMPASDATTERLAALMAGAAEDPVAGTE